MFDEEPLEDYLSKLGRSERLICLALLLTTLGCSNEYGLAETVGIEEKTEASTTAAILKRRIRSKDTSKNELVELFEISKSMGWLVPIGENTTTDFLHDTEAVLFAVFKIFELYPDVYVRSSQVRNWLKRNYGTELKNPTSTINSLASRSSPAIKFANESTGKREKLFQLTTDGVREAESIALSKD